MTLRGTSSSIAAILLAASCSLGSDLDALKGGPGTGGDSAFDASFDGPLEGGKCAPGADCTGCADCQAWCACLVGTNVTQCLAACSGTGGSAGTSGSGGSGGAGGTIESGGGTGGATGGTGGATGGTGGATGGTGGSIGGSGGATGGGGGATGGSGGSTDGGGTAGASGGTPGYVTCGGSKCSLATSFCCVPYLSGNTQTCQQLGASCSGASGKAFCDGPEDCPGQKCCYSTFSGANCGATCSAASTLCHGDGDCPAGTLCTESTQFKGFSICG